VSTPLDSLVAELDGVAERLRSGDLDAAGAAQLVERCAEVAAGLSAELERMARAVPAEPVPGQVELPGAPVAGQGELL